MKLDAIKAEWQSDSAIDPSDIPGELYKISRLHSKYYNMLLSEKQVYKLREIEYNKLKKIKRQYYSGKFSRRLLAELGWPAIDEEVKPSDLPDYLKGDSDLCDLEAKMYIQEIKIDFLKDVLKAIHNRGMNIHTAVEMFKVQHGEK